MDRATLFCSSIDLLYSLDNPTPFCTFGGKYTGRFFYISCSYTIIFTGIVQSFFYLQVTTFWLLNIFALYWKIQFPFHARYYDTTKQTKYIHIACVVVAFVFPITAPVTVSATGGFTITRFHPLYVLEEMPMQNFTPLCFQLQLSML